MEISPRAAELTTLLESRISNFYTNFQVDEIGRVVSVGDGIARVGDFRQVFPGGAEQSKKKAKQMKFQVKDNHQLDNQKIRNLFNKIKREINKTIKNEEKKEFLNTLADSLCKDLIRRGNLINNRKKILRPLSPHLPIYKPQLTSTFSIFHRISGAFLATIVSIFYLICMKIGLICFTYENFYQFLFYSKKLILISVEITALALSYHLYNGLCHLLTDLSGFLFLGGKRLK